MRAGTYELRWLVVGCLALGLSGACGQNSNGPGGDLEPPDADADADTVAADDAGGDAGGAPQQDAAQGADGGGSSGPGAPTVVGRNFDGEPQDIVLAGDTVLVAEGRNVAIFSALTGEYLGDTAESPYTEPPLALEYDRSASGGLYMASAHTITFRPTTGAVRSWTYSGSGEIVDLKILPALAKVIVLCSHELIVLDNSGATLVQRGSVAAPTNIPYFRRLALGVVGAKQLAMAMGDLAGAGTRGAWGLVIIELNVNADFSAPALRSVWNPIPTYTNLASVRNVVVVANYNGSGQDVALIAGGAAGQLLRLAITDLTAPVVLDKTVIQAGASINNLLLDGNRLLVVGDGLLFSVDASTLAALGSNNLAMGAGGARDIVLWHSGAAKVLWSAAFGAVNYLVQGIDVHTDTPTALYKDWWVSSSDGAVAAPAWSSVYRPTFNGVGRYDVSDPTHPQRVAAGFHPAQSITEHIDLLYPDPLDPTQALLLTATGTGGFESWPVSAALPDPPASMMVTTRPPGWAGQNVYQNDVTWYRAGGSNYVLVDLANLNTKHAALMVYNLSTSTWLTVETASANATPRVTTTSVVTAGDYAVVSWGPGFFVVSLKELPLSLSIVDEVTVDLDGDGTLDGAAGLAPDADGSHLFVSGAGKGGLVSYALDQTTGAVTGPLSVATNPALGGSTSRARYNPISHRVYAASNDGHISEIDATDPAQLHYLSYWDNGFGDEMQDARIYDFGAGPRVLAVSNTLGFAILDPQD